MSRRPLLAALAALLLLAAGCGVIRDAGPETTRTQEVSGDVVGVDLAMSGAVVVRAGSPASLTMTGGENLLDHVRTRVDGDGVLVIDLDGPGMWRDADLSATLVVPEPSIARLSGSGVVRVEAPSGDELAVVLGGSGTVEASDVRVSALEVDLGGSGTVRASGRCRTQDVSISGSGTYDGVALDSQDATVGVSGSGRAEVTVTGTLDATISGSGSITYDGGPSVTSEVSGSGSIAAR